MTDFTDMPVGATGLVTGRPVERVEDDTWFYAPDSTEYAEVRVFRDEDGGYVFVVDLTHPDDDADRLYYASFEEACEAVERA